MAESVTKGFFPSQVVSDNEKTSREYGLKVARAIESEWFKRDSGTNRFYNNQITTVDTSKQEILRLFKKFNYIK